MNQTDTMLESVLPDEIPMDLNEVEISRPRDSYRETGKDKIFQGVIAKAFAGVSLNNCSCNQRRNACIHENSGRGLYGLPSGDATQ